VIFMVTAPLISPGAIDLPSVGMKLTAPVTPMEVTLNADGTLTFTDNEAKTAPLKVTREQLVARVQAKQNRLPDQPVVIGASGKARYEEVLKVLELLQTNGVHKVGLLARPTGS
jgi:biopolymer transport protein TolR